MYKITIEKITPTKTIERDWQRLRDAYPDEKDMSEEQKTNDRQYGYTTIEREKNVSQIVLQQEIEEIDISNVIKAINNI